MGSPVFNKEVHSVIQKLICSVFGGSTLGEGGGGGSSTDRNGGEKSPLKTDSTNWLSVDLNWATQVFIVLSLILKGHLLAACFRASTGLNEPFSRLEKTLESRC